MNIGLFFGSFNPVHIGHLVIADALVTYSELDRVWFIVTPQNPHKKRSNLIHEFDRLDMVRAAIEGNEKLEVSDIEFGLPRPSYTIDTLIHLDEKYSEYEFHLIMGGDNLDSLPKWKNSHILLERYKIMVYPRPGAPSSTLEEHPSVNKINGMPYMDISASMIRKALREEKSVRYLIPEKVGEIIESRKLYK